MPLTAGDKLGHYEILSLLGTGGMGEVYRARDTKLKRDVALKVLPEAFARDPGRMARFQREAEVLASLNHPNIAAIYGVEERALVMELVEGEHPHGPLPLDTALNYARQIADALEYAHDRGVIHRDLKPANVKVTPQGVVKLLDFGLAKAIAPEPEEGETRTADSPTLTMGAMGATVAGVILGTAAYMSPEQARGKPAGKRSDIWAFGALLYELLTGKAAFQGESTTDILASVVKEQPSFDAIPPHVRPLIARCLRKEARQRWQAIGDIRVTLEEGFAEAPAAAPAEIRTGRAGWIAAALATLLAGVALWGWLKPRPVERRIVTRFSFPIPLGTPFSFGVGISRDGSRIAFSAGRPPRIHVRDMDQLEARPLAGTEGGQTPQFSPDGQSLLFMAGGQIKRIAVAGGPAQLLAPASAFIYPTWGIDNDIRFGNGLSLLQMPAGGGAPETLFKLDEQHGETQLAAPQLLPGGRAILFSSLSRTQAQTSVLNLQTKERRILTEVPGIGWYTPTGHILYTNAGSLFAVPFDADRLQITGSPVPVLEGVLSLGPIGMFAFSDSGTLAYQLGGSFLTNVSLVWVNRQGVEQVLPEPARGYSNVRVSHDGDKIAVPVNDANSSASDVWVKELPDGPLTRRTFGGQDRNPVFSADGKRIVHNSGRGNAPLLATSADGSATPVTILTSEAGPQHTPYSAAPDGRLVGIRAGQGGGGNQVWVLPPGETKTQAILESAFTKTNLQFSADGHWLAYQSNESGRDEVYVIPYPGSGGTSQVSLEGGTVPRWSRDGRELFFRSGTKMMAAKIQTSPSFRLLGTPTSLFDYPASGATTAYDIGKDGRFLMLKNNAVGAGAGEIHVVVNWFEELRRRAPAGK